MFSFAIQAIGAVAGIIVAGIVLLTLFGALFDQMGEVWLVIAALVALFVLWVSYLKGRG